MTESGHDEIEQFPRIVWRLRNGRQNVFCKGGVFDIIVFSEPMNFVHVMISFW